MFPASQVFLPSLIFFSSSIVLPIYPAPPFVFLSPSPQVTGVRNAGRRERRKREIKGKWEERRNSRRIHRGVQ
jgi:hypothetical protein